MSKAKKRFDEKLILNSYMLSLMGVDSFDELALWFKDGNDCASGREIEYRIENGQSDFCARILENLSDETMLQKDDIEKYDKNIIHHTKKLGREIRWKYFQYLMLLFVEIYLDRFFRDRDLLLEELNIFLENFNESLPKRERIEPFQREDLNKLALWSATGSGKTLIMHVNIMQFRQHADQKLKVENTLLLTPNEGLSAQHLEEFEASHIEAKIFEENESFDGVKILEITKLADEAKDKTVAVDSFEDRNLVLIDEGHRGSGGDTWKKNRDKLSENGFAFEYSATFGQAINATNANKRKSLIQEYAKAILFDYSYRYFYHDGYGKEYAILNLDSDDEEARFTYLVASMLGFYQQLRIFEDHPTLMAAHNIEKPLMVFVGHSVNNPKKLSNEDQQTVSDVINVLIFLNKFVANDSGKTVRTIDDILKGASGMIDHQGKEIFVNRFAYLSSRGMNASTIFDDLRHLVFGRGAGKLHLDHFTGVEGEIGLRIGEGNYFGVVNVGESSKLSQACEHSGLSVTKKAIADSLFAKIKRNTSRVNLLIGAKKFTEGWSSWRVSTMGLMHVGKGEGSQIIQLFGRGVRLKGENFSLKRSRCYGHMLDRPLQAVETLNVFGVKANYMHQFKEYLEKEGLPTQERIEFLLPVIRDEKYKEKRLKTLRIKAQDGFQREEKVYLAYEKGGRFFKRVKYDHYSRISTNESIDENKSDGNIYEGKLEKVHLAFVDIDRIFFELERYKREQEWNNLVIEKSKIEELLEKKDWYTLLIEPKELEIGNETSFEELEKRYENIVLDLLKSYTKALYQYKKMEWESRFMEYVELDETDENLIDEYVVRVEERQDDLIRKLEALKELLDSGTLDDLEFGNLSRGDFEVLTFEQHLYNPLLYKGDKLSVISISPVALNDGEKSFIKDLKSYMTTNASSIQDMEIFLLRNQSKRGIGFFDAGNFYPDFIMWILHDRMQHIVFIDPKGLRNIDIVNGVKVNFYKEIKRLEKRLGDDSITLDSFILSTTPYDKLREVHSTLSKEELEAKHVLFQIDDRHTYIDKLFQMTIGNDRR